MKTLALVTTLATAAILLAQPEEPTAETKDQLHSLLDSFSVLPNRSGDGVAKLKKQLEAAKMIRNLGWKAAPLVIQYARTNSDGKILVADSSTIVAKALGFLTPEHKKLVDSMINDWLVDPDPNVRANAVGLVHPGIRKDYAVHLMTLSQSDTDYRVQIAIKLRSLNWGWRSRDGEMSMQQLEKVIKKAEAEASAAGKTNSPISSDR